MIGVPHNQWDWRATRDVFQAHGTIFQSPNPKTIPRSNFVLWPKQSMTWSIDITARISQVAWIDASSLPSLIRISTVHNGLLTTVSRGDSGHLANWYHVNYWSTTGIHGPKRRHIIDTYFAKRCTEYCRKYWRTDDVVCEGVLFECPTGEWDPVWTRLKYSENMRGLEHDVSYRLTRFFVRLGE